MAGLAYFFKDLFENAGLMDVELNLFRPTWIYGRSSEVRVARHLDKFLVSDHLLQLFEKFKSWIGVDPFSDHQPIWMQVDKEDSWKPFPFKFNRTWNQDKEFQ